MGVCGVWEYKISYVYSVTYGRLSSRDWVFGRGGDKSSRHKTGQGCTEHGATLRNASAWQNSRIRSSVQVSIRGFLCMTMSSIVQMIVSEFLGFPCRFL